MSDVNRAVDSASPAGFIQLTRKQSHSPPLIQASNKRRGALPSSMDLTDPPSPSTSSRRRSPRRHKTHNTASEGSVDQQTPKLRRSPERAEDRLVSDVDHGSRKSFYSASLNALGTVPSLRQKSQTTGSSSDSPTKRPTSPVKRMADLQFTDRRINYVELGDDLGEILGDVRELCKELVAYVQGIKVIPHVIKASQTEARTLLGLLHVH